MFIPLWVLISFIALVLYRIKKLLDETGAQKAELAAKNTEIKELETSLTEAVDWVTKYKKLLVNTKST